MFAGEEPSRKIFIRLSTFRGGLEKQQGKEGKNAFHSQSKEHFYAKSGFASSLFTYSDLMINGLSASAQPTTSSYLKGKKFFGKPLITKRVFRKRVCQNELGTRIWHNRP